MHAGVHDLLIFGVVSLQVAAEKVSMRLQDKPTSPCTTGSRCCGEGAGYRRRHVPSDKGAQPVVVAALPVGCEGLLVDGRLVSLWVACRHCVWSVLCSDISHQASLEPGARQDTADCECPQDTSAILRAAAAGWPSAFLSAVQSGQSLNDPESLLVGILQISQLLSNSSSDFSAACWNIARLQSVALKGPVIRL